MRLGVSPAAAPTPTGVFNQRFEALFYRAGALGFGVCFSPLPFLPVYLCANVGPRGLLAAALPAPVPESSISLGPPAAALPQVLPSLAACLCPSTGLDERFFFISLVDGLPYSSIFCQFWLFFVFKLLLSFWLCEEAQCVYLCLHLGQKVVQVFSPFFN